MEKDTITTTVMDITPDFATRLLEDMVPNRTVGYSTVQAYAAAMTAGDWELNGEPIILDTDGRLLDGQHRCWAVIESKVAIQALVVRGIDAESFATIDTGRKRTASQVLAMDGRAYTKTLASALRLLLDWEEHKAARTKVGTYTNKQLVEVADDYPHLVESTRLAHALTDLRGILPRSVIAFCHYLFTGKHAVQANLFFEELADGAGLAKTDPVAQLYRRLVADAVRGNNKRRPDQIELCIRAWNLRRRGKQVTKLQLGTHDDNFKFPTPK